MSFAIATRTPAHVLRRAASILVERFPFRPARVYDAAANAATSLAGYQDAHSATDLEAPNAPAPTDDASLGTILVVEDDATMRALLSRVLARRGFKLIMVDDGHQACEAALRESPDLVLLDWRLPVMDGRAVTERLKAHPLTRQIPVVMLTGQSHVGDKVTALEAGVQDFLTKPFEARELIARIEQQLRWRRLLSPDSGKRTGTTADPTGDLWMQAVEASRLGRGREALTLFLAEAERCSDGELFPRAAVAYRSASMEAKRLGDEARAGELLRSAGEMYRSWAETTPDVRAVQEGYASAARCFLAAGDAQAAKASADLASSFASVVCDDEPAGLE